MFATAQAAIIGLLLALCSPMTVGDELRDEQAPTEHQHILVVVGANGTAEYGAAFREWADRWETAAAAGDARYHAIGLQDEPDDLQQFNRKLSEWSTIETTEPLWLVLIGHGTFDGRTARFNLDGPDLAAEDLAALLATSTRPVAVIDCSSSSSPFINGISGPGRAVVTATKDGNEIQFARFGGFLSEAIAGLDADVDRDGQTSLLEAWLFASRRTAEFYESEGRLATEHSLLEDSGDAKGSRAELFEGVRVKDNVKEPEKVDGRLARRWHLVRSSEERLLTAEERLRRDELEQQLESLRSRKSELADDVYMDTLESILLPLAVLYDQASQRSAPPASLAPEHDAAKAAN
ncbi:MAG: hypothetical protein R3C19_03080 [Planctomycetaceae bacterium]